MRGEPLLTIFTPTFNRKNELLHLFDSLMVQSDMRFEWLIIDDGSGDGTEELVSTWAVVEKPFSMRYVYQENGGKHVAHNKAAALANGSLFMCVDSDDWLDPDAVKVILAEQLRKDDAGIVFPKLLIENEQPRNTPWFPPSVDRIELSDMRMKYGLVIETAIVFRTEVLRRHPFPIVEGERFMPEGATYYDYRAPEVFVVDSTPFYQCSYLEDGLTKNIYRNWLNNPNGTIMALAKRYEAAGRYANLRSVRERMAAIIGIESLNMAVGMPVHNGLKCNLFAMAMMLPFSAVFARKRYKGLIDACKG